MPLWQFQASNVAIQVSKQQIIIFIAISSVIVIFIVVVIAMIYDLGWTLIFESNTEQCFTKTALFCMRPKRATCANPLYGLIFPPCAFQHPSLHVWAGVLPCHSHLVTTGKGLLQWNSVPHNRPLKILTAHHLALLSNTKTPRSSRHGSLFICRAAS